MVPRGLSRRKVGDKGEGRTVGFVACSRDVHFVDNASITQGKSPQQLAVCKTVVLLVGEVPRGRGEMRLQPTSCKRFK